MMSANVAQPEANLQRSESGLRYVVESLVALALAVMLVRTFVVEGYIISTGSMAPFLLGYHKQVVCPECRFAFAVGVPVDDGHDTSGPVACPNCGQQRIDLSSVPRNEGDQLLVQKFAYLLRRPKRWEVVVFQNPSHPTQAYVKRVLGLPNEAIQVRAGDIWINDELARKNLAEQRSTRLAIYRWNGQQGRREESRWRTESGWNMSAEGIRFAPESPQSMDTNILPLSWVTYLGNTSPHGGDQVEQSPLQPWPADDYAYNGLAERTPRYRVRDLMLSMQVEFQRGRGAMAWSLSDGEQTFEVRLAAGSRELQFFIDDADEPETRLPLSGSIWQRPRLVEMSLFDRQLLFALDGEVVIQKPLEPLKPIVKNDLGSAKNSRFGTPVKFGAHNLEVFISDLTLYRDVYYTRGDGRHGVSEPHQLGPNEYFFLGDNSPVSLDSRSWDDTVVSDNMLIGKPFLVHLPSRPGRIKLGSAEWHIRVPDWGRIRYIR